MENSSGLEAVALGSPGILWVTVSLPVSDIISSPCFGRTVGKYGKGRIASQAGAELIFQRRTCV